MCPRGNGWKQSEIAPSLGKKTCFLHNFQILFMNICYKTTKLLFCRAKVRSRTVSNRFPLDTLDLQKNCVARKCFKKIKRGLDKFWPDHVSDCFRPFLTVSDRFRQFPTVSDRFIFSERLYNWTNSMYGRLIQCKPVQTMTLKFFCSTLVRVHCTNIASWRWYQIFPKNHKIPGAREI